MLLLHKVLKFQIFLSFSNHFLSFDSVIIQKNIRWGSGLAFFFLYLFLIFFFLPSSLFLCLPLLLPLFLFWRMKSSMLCISRTKAAINLRSSTISHTPFSSLFPKWSFCHWKERRRTTLCGFLTPIVWAPLSFAFLFFLSSILVETLVLLEHNFSSRQCWTFRWRGNCFLEISILGRGFQWKTCWEILATFRGGWGWIRQSFGDDYAFLFFTLFEGQRQAILSCAPFNRSVSQQLGYRPCVVGTAMAELLPSGSICSSKADRQ